MTAEELKRKLRNGDVPPLLLLYGEETWLIREMVSQVRRAVLQVDNDDFNDHQFIARETTAGQVLEAVMTLPVFAPRRLVTVKDFHNFPAHEMEQLATYLNDPAAETCLLLVADKIDSRKRFFKEFKKKGTQVEFKPLAEKQVPGYVRQTLDSHDIRISADALNLFCSLVGSSLYELRSELDKLINYLGDRNLVDLTDVEEVISRSRGENIFELGEAVATGNVAKAQQLAVKLNRAGEAPLRTLALIVMHFRRLWKVRELQVQNAASAEIAKVAQIPPFVVDKMVKQGKRFSRSDFIAVFERFLETDLAMKSSGADAAALLEQLVLRLALMKQH